MKTKNPISKSRIKCSQCRRLAVMFLKTIPYCKYHAPYLIQMKGGKK